MVYIFDDFELDGDCLELRRTGKALQADALVLRLLAYLVQNAGKLISKEELIEKVWDGRSVADNAITVSMARLRKLLGQQRGDDEYVSTTYGRGYRFVREVVVRYDERPVAAQPLPKSEFGSPFVGRERALVQLRRALAEARAGRGRCCLLLGEPGIGKTRVAETLARELGDNKLSVAWGFCREAGDTPPLWPWLRLISEVLPAARGGNPLGGLPEELRAFLGLGMSPGPESLASTINLSTSPERHRHFDAILRLLIRAAEHNPWVLVIDDLHRADAASLELLGQLLDEISHSRLLVIATLRHLPGRRAPRAGTHLPHVIGHRNSERIQLERLEEVDVVRYVGALLEDEGGALGRAVFKKSEGNPFFMTELARALADSERLEASGLELPAAALELVRQRVSRFEPELREVLSAAAVVGRSFELPLLASVIEREPSRLMTALDEAIESDVVVAAPGSMTAFAFGHELLREVLYDSLAPKEQRRWHARVAAVLDARVASGDSVPPSELAYHFHSALPDGDARKTVEYCRAAAAAAGAVFASPDVVRYARHALEALELVDRPSLRLRMSLLYLMAMYARGHAPRECERAIREVAHMAMEQGDRVMLLRAAMMFNVAPGLPPLPGQTALLEHVLTMLHPHDVGFRGASLSALAVATPYCYSAERSRALMDEAMPLVRKSQSPLAHYSSLLAKLYLVGGPVHYTEAGEVALELERLAVQHPAQMPVLPISLAHHRAVQSFQQGDRMALMAAIDRGCMRARVLHSAQKIWYCERFALLARLQFTPSREALHELERSVYTEQGTIWGSELFCAFDGTVTRAQLGQAAPLSTELHDALRYESADPPGVWAIKLRALTESGRLDEARGALRAVPAAELAQLPCDADYLGTLGNLTRAVLILRMTDYAEALYALLAPYSQLFAVGYTLFCDGSIAQLQGMLAEYLGRNETAITHLELGLRHNERIGLNARAHETRLQLARCLRKQRSGDAQRQALELAREAHAGATRLGQPRLIEEALQLFPDAGE